MSACTASVVVAIEVGSTVVGPTAGGVGGGGGDGGDGGGDGDGGDEIAAGVGVVDGMMTGSFGVDRMMGVVEVLARMLTGAAV